LKKEKPKEKPAPVAASPPSEPVEPEKPKDLKPVKKQLVEEATTVEDESKRKLEELKVSYWNFSLTKILHFELEYYVIKILQSPSSAKYQIHFRKNAKKLQPKRRRNNDKR
jgi:hypothetical protein